MRRIAAIALVLLAMLVASPAQTTPPRVPSRFAIVPPERPECREQQRCVIDLQTVDGQKPFAWQIRQGKLPAGLSLDRNTGRIAGTPTVPGTSTVTAIVKALGGGWNAVALQNLTVRPAARQVLQP